MLALLNKKKYVAPSALSLLPREIKKKDYNIEADLYPTLNSANKGNNKGTHSKSNNSNNNGNNKGGTIASIPNSKISFASIINTKNTEKKESEPPNEDTPPPGWVYIKREEGMIYYKYGIMSDSYLSTLIEQQKYAERQDRVLFKQRIARLQKDRDIMNDLLGDLSPYWNEKTLYETYNLENENIENENIENELMHASDTNLSDEDEEEKKSKIKEQRETEEEKKWIPV